MSMPFSFPRYSMSKRYIARNNPFDNIQKNPGPGSYNYNENKYDKNAYK